MAGVVSTLGDLVVRIVAQTKEFDKSIDKTEKKTKDFETGVTKMTKSLKGLVTGVAVATLVKKIGEVADASINAASEAEEVQAKFETAFDGIEAKATETAASLAKNYGLSSTESKKLLGNTGDLLKGFGATATEALSFSEEIQQLSVDLASYNNVQGGAARVSNILTKSVLGNKDGLSELGVSLLDVDIKQELVRTGQDKLTGQAGKLAKAQATFNLILQQTGDAQNDFARTQDSYANQTRIATANIKDLQVQLGQGLLPVATAGVGVFNNLVTSVTAYLTKVNDTAIALRALETGTATLAQKRAVVEREYQEQVEELIELRQKADKNVNNSYRQQIINKELELQGIRNTRDEIDKQIAKEEELREEEIKRETEKAQAQAKEDARVALRESQYKSEIKNIDNIIDSEKTEIELIDDQIEALKSLEAKDEETRQKQLKAIEVLQGDKQELLDEERAEREAAYQERVKKENENANEVYQLEKDLAEKKQKLREEEQEEIQDNIENVKKAAETLIGFTEQSTTEALGTVADLTAEIGKNSGNLYLQIGGEVVSLATDIINAFENAAQETEKITEDLANETTSILERNEREWLERSKQNRIDAAEDVAEEELNKYLEGLSEQEKAQLKLDGVLEESTTERINRERESAKEQSKEAIQLKIDELDALRLAEIGNAELTAEEITKINEDYQSDIADLKEDQIEALSTAEIDANADSQIKINDIRQTALDEAAQAEKDYQNAIAQLNYEQAVNELAIKKAEIEAEKEVALASLWWDIFDTQRSTVSGAFDNAISTISGVTIPPPVQLATGAIIPGSMRGTPAIVGENGADELILGGSAKGDPILNRFADRIVDRMGGMGGMTVNFYGKSMTNRAELDQFARDFYQSQIKEQQRRGING